MEVNLERIAVALEHIADLLGRIDKTMIESKTIQAMRDSREATNPSEDTQWQS